MAKPENIIILRHSQSAGNANRDIYTQIPDYALPLTAAGKQQASDRGRQLQADVFQNGAVACYCSPYFRTRQTLDHAKAHFYVSYEYYDPRLREQEWGTSLSGFREDWELERDSYSVFYWRFPNGESCADVFDRISSFNNTLHRDFEKPEFPRNALISTHGMTARLFLMRWFHWSVEQFELLANPENCGYYHLQLNKLTNKYDLITPPRVHSKPKHEFKYDPNA